GATRAPSCTAGPQGTPSSILPLHPTVEGTRDDPGRKETAPDIDLDRRAGCRHAGRNVAESDERAQRGGTRPAGDASDRDAVPAEGVAMARYARLVELDADQAPLDARLRLRDERGAADEVALAELPDPARGGLKRRGGSTQCP